MRKTFPVEDLARDERFVRVSDDRALRRPADSRHRAAPAPAAAAARAASRPTAPTPPDAARALMHGIFVGEIQALEGAGRTCWDFEVGTQRRGIDEVPFELKLDMARQCWDEARHCEISVKLSDWMGTEIGEFSERTFLYEAACNPDPVLRLTGVNRALEGLAIDVFNTMREFGDDRRRPGARVLRGLDARRRGHPREDGLRLAAPPHRQRPRARRSGPSSSSGSSTSSSPSAASAARRTTARSAWPAASASWPASTPTRSTRSPRSPARPARRSRPCAEAGRAAARRAG